MSHREDHETRTEAQAAQFERDRAADDIADTLHDQRVEALAGEDPFRG